MNALVRTELLKQRTTPVFLVGAAAVPAVAALVAFAILSLSGEQDNPPLGPDSLAQVIGGPAGAVTLVALLLGVLAVTGEYRHQTITTTFLATPRRGGVVMAKVAAGALAGAALGLASVAVSAAIAVPWLASAGVPVGADGDVVRVAGGLVVSTAFYGALGVAAGALVRNQTAAVGAVLAWLLAAEGLIGLVLRDSPVLHWLPAAAGRALVHAGSGTAALPAPAAAGALLAWVVVLAGAATRFTVRADIT